MSPSENKRDAVEAAARPLRERQRAESGRLAAAESALRRADREHDRAARRAGGGRLRRRARRSEDDGPTPGHGDARSADAADARSEARAQTRSLLGDLGDLLEADEDALDMAAAVHAGHDGILVVSDRRLVFVAPRRRLSLRRGDIASIEAKGHRWSGTRIVVTSEHGKTTFSAVRRRHAEELVELLREPAGAATT